jgi:hypothetical protein
MFNLHWRENVAITIQEQLLTSTSYYDGHKEDLMPGRTVEHPSMMACSDFAKNIVLQRSPNVKVIWAFCECVEGAAARTVNH